MNVLSADGIGRDLGERWLFKDLTFGILQGEKVALIGANGSGKSSLLKILSGQAETDGGTVSLNQGIRMGFLEQEPELEETQTVIETIFYAENEITTAMKNYEKAVEKGDQGLMAEAIETLDLLQAWDYEAKVKQVLGKLGIQDFEKPLGQLSGGQKKRVALARVLIDQPDFLILDEPTNHLDLETIEWLEGYLSSGNTTLLLVTHDRYFLDKVCNRILEIDSSGIHKYTGNYAYYLEKKEERREIEEATHEKNQNRLKKELEWMRRQPKARTTKAQYRIDAFHELKEKAKGVRREESVELNVRTERLGKKIVEIQDISKSYANKSLVSHFSYTFKQGDKIGVVGKNGVGKTTFLDIIQDLVKPDSGRVIRGETVKVGYYSQSGLSFRNDQRIIDVVREIADYIKLGDGRELPVSNFLSLFLFPPKKQHQFVEKLSGGEKRRLQLLKVLVESPNFLILDEPTNDLDIDTLNVLEEFLENFGGCVLVVTHDRYFMDKVVDHVFAFEGKGLIKDFPGNYTQYRLWKDAKEKEQVAGLKAKASGEHKTESLKTEEKRKLTFKEKREFEALEGQIAEMEKRKSEIVEQMNGQETDFALLQQLGQELEQLKQDIEVAELRWLELDEYAT